MVEYKYIRRHAEKSINDYEKIFKALIVTVPSKSGKSTMQKHIKSILYYVTFDNTVVRKQFIDDKINFFKSFKMPLVLDSILREQKK